MTTILLAVVTLVLTVTAFAFKNAILHFVCTIIWIVFGVTMMNQPWPSGNTFLGVAFILIALAMAIVNLVITVNHYLGQRTAPPTHDEVQRNYKRKILSITKPESFLPPRGRDDEPWL